MPGIYQSGCCTLDIDLVIIHSWVERLPRLTPGIYQSGCCTLVLTRAGQLMIHARLNSGLHEPRLLCVRVHSVLYWIRSLLNSSPSVCHELLGCEALGPVAPLGTPVGGCGCGVTDYVRFWCQDFDILRVLVLAIQNSPCYVRLWGQDFDILRVLVSAIQNSPCYVRLWGQDFDILGVFGVSNTK